VITALHPLELRLERSRNVSKVRLDCLLGKLSERYRVGFVEQNRQARIFYHGVVELIVPRMTDDLSLATIMNDCAFVLVDSPIESSENIVQLRAARTDNIIAKLTDADEPTSWIKIVRHHAMDDVPICGLVLAGGCSKRMGKDKALLRYRNRLPQGEVVYRLLENLCAKTYVSVRAGQDMDNTLTQFPLLPDRFLGIGPMGGMLTAMTTDVNSAWLVVACDLPFLDHATLQRLLEQRDPLQVATAYRSAYDGLAEPLCAVYEPRARIQLMKALGHGCSCPRTVLEQSSTCLLELDNDHALDNVNRPEEYARAFEILQT